MKECDILGDHNILWLLHIFRGISLSGLLNPHDLRPEWGI